MSFTKPGKHLTACVVASAAGHVLPPFFIYEGKRNMDHWYEPLPPEVFKDSTGVPHWLAQDNWYPDHAAEYGIDKVSMTMDTIALLMSHINLHAPSKPGPENKILLILDGHKSRNGSYSLEKAMMFNIEVVQSPANTTQFLQPCDNDINHKVHNTIRETHDHLNSIAQVNFADTSNRLNLAIAGYRSLTPDIVRQAFVNTGMWPMDFRFHQWALEKYSGKKAVREREEKRVEVRRSVQHLKAAQQIMSHSMRPRQKWEALANYVQAADGQVKDIIEECTPTKKKTVRFVIEDRSGFDVSKAAPAAYLTHKGVLELRKNLASEKEEEKQAKIIEKKRKVEEREKAKALREQKKIEAKQSREEKQKEKASQAKEKGKIVGDCNPLSVCKGSSSKSVGLGTGNVQSVKQTFRGKMEIARNAATVNERLAVGKENCANEAARVLLEMHNMDPNLADTYDVVFDESVGDQSVLSDATFQPITLMKKGVPVPQCP